jgi:hypothetical protein
MEVFVLTKDMMGAARTYMPLETKKVLAETIADKCVKPMARLKWDGIHIRPRGEGETANGHDPTALPDLMEEDVALKLRLLQNVLLGYYFDIELNENPEAEQVYEQYDYYAGGHLLNQIERFKSDRDVKNAAFDLMEDFREFRKMVDTIIYNYKMNANDPLKRFDAMLTVFSTPENIRAMVNELQKAGDEMEKKIKGAKNAKRQKSEKVLNPIPEAEHGG